MRFKGFFLPVLTLSVILFLGCATPYQPMGFTGGYKDESIGNNIYYIAVRVNAYTDEITAYEYFNRRARQLCRGEYEVLEMNKGYKTNFNAYEGNLQQHPRVYGKVKCKSDTP